MGNKIRVTMDFSPEAWNALNELSQDLHVTKATVISKALGWLQFVAKERVGKPGGAQLVLKGPRFLQRREIVSL